MSLHLKYRPDTFDDVYGNEQTVATLKALLDKPDKPHAWLLTGPTGGGKTTLGRIIARELGAAGDDYREIDSADFRGVDTIREIRKRSQFAPMEGSCRVYLLDEVHAMGKVAMEALLKALEDTPAHVYFILCTTDPQKLLPTIRGRCSQHAVTALNERQMMKLLRHVVKAEGESLSKQIYEQIALDSAGLPRAALQILNQVLVVDEDQRMEVAKQQAERVNQTIELCRALMQGAGWKKVSNILQGLKEEDPEGIRRQVLGYCSTVLLKDGNNAAAVVLEEFKEPFWNAGFPGLVVACYAVVSG